MVRNELLSVLYSYRLNSVTQNDGFREVYRTWTMEPTVWRGAQGNTLPVPGTGILYDVKRSTVRQ